VPKKPKPFHPTVVTRPAKADVKRAVMLAQQPDASYLPGWSGPHHA
jgi:hypothetical protein